MEKSGVRETRWLFFILMISHICLGAIGELTKAMATGSIIGLLISAVIALAIVFVTETCLGSGGTQSIKSSLGNGFHGALAIVLFVITLLNSAQRMKDFSLAIGSTVLLQSPEVFILFIMSVASFVVALVGMEAITRYALVASGVFFVFAGALFFTNIHRAEIVNIYPLGGKNGFPNPFCGLYVFSDVVYFFFIQKNVNNSKKISYPISKTIITVAVTAVAITLFYCLCVPYPASTMYKYPLYRLSLLANSSVVFQRLDGLVYLIWIFFSFICQGALVVFAMDIVADALMLKNKKAIAASVSFICFFISLMNFDFTFFVRRFSVAFAFLVFPVCALRVKKGRKRNEQA